MENVFFFTLGEYHLLKNKLEPGRVAQLGTITMLKNFKEQNVYGASSSND